ncbi:MAG: hypothetical protein ACFFAS_06715 [Promethearchaeota archaeon]
MNDNANVYNQANLEKKKIEKLQSEIDQLNQNILDKLSFFNLEKEASSPYLRDKLTTLKNIIISQRQEITWKNDDIKNLEIKVSDLINELIELKEKGIKIAPEQQNSQYLTENYESQIVELNQIVKDLELENASLRNNLSNNYRSIDNQSLELSIQRLNSRIKELEEENKRIEEKNRMLKAALLMTVDNETTNTTDTSLTTEEEEIVNIDIKEEKQIFIKEGPTTVSHIEKEGDLLGRKRKCPKCGATSAFILEIDDKENIIYHNPRIYGKKYKCGDCSHEWR